MWPTWKETLDPNILYYNAPLAKPLMEPLTKTNMVYLLKETTLIT